MSPSEHSVRARVAERLRRLAAVVDPQRTVRAARLDRGPAIVDPVETTRRHREHLDAIGGRGDIARRIKARRA